MEGLQKLVRKVSGDPESYSSIIENHSHYSGSGSSSVPVAVSSDQAGVLVTRSARQVVSLWTCSKLCGISLAVGFIAGYTFQKRVKRWAARLLKKLRDD